MPYVLKLIFFLMNYKLLTMNIILVENEKSLNTIQRAEIDIMYLVIIFESLLVDIKVATTVLILGSRNTLLPSDSIVNNFAV